MELKDKTKVIDSTKRIKECDQVITYFKINNSHYNKDFINEVIEEFEKDKKKEVARIKTIYFIKKLKEKLPDEEE